MEAGFSRQGFLLRVDLTVAVFELDRWDVVEGAVESVVVEPVDPAEGGELELVDGAEGPVVANALSLVEPDDRLGRESVRRPPA